MSMLQGFTQFINIRIMGTSNLKGISDDAVKALDKLEERAKKMRNIGLGISAIGAAMVGLGVMAGLSTKDTQAALGEMSSVGIKDLKALEEAATRFSNQWAGVDKPSFIKAAYDIKGGIFTLSDTAVAEYTRMAAITAKGTKATVEEMTKLFATGYGIYKSFYSSLSDMEFGDLFAGGIAGAVNIFRSTGPEMNAAISNLGASATSALIPLEEQLAILGMLQATMSGSEAGTKYRAFIMHAAEAGKKLGVSFVDANKQVLPMANILEKIKVKYGGTVDALEKVKIKEAFGTKEAVAVIDLLIPQIEVLKGNVASMSDLMKQGTGAASVMAEAMNKDLGAQLSLLKQRFQNTMEVLGSGISPILSSIAVRLSSVVMSFQEWGTQHPQLLKIAGIMGLITGAIVLVRGAAVTMVGMLGLLIPAVINAAVAMGIGTAASLTFTGALSGIAGVLWGIMAPILPIIGAVALLYLSWKNNFWGLKDTVNAVWFVLQKFFGYLKPTFIAVKTVIVDTVGGMIKAVSNWYVSWKEKLFGGVQPIYYFAGKVAYAIGFVVGIFRKLFGWFSQHKVLGATLLAVFAGGALGIFKYARAAGGLMTGIKNLPLVMKGVADSIAILSERLKSFDPSILPGKIKSAFSAMGQAAQNGFKTVKTGILNLGNSLVTAAKSAWAFSVNMVKSTIAWTGSFVKSIAMVGKQLGLLVWNLVKAGGQVLMFGLKMIWAGMQAGGQFVKGIALTTITLVKQAGQFIISKVVMLASAAAQGILTAAQWALNVAMSANPLGLVIAAVAALISLGYVLYKNWDVIWAGIKTSIDFVWQGLISGWNRVTGILLAGWTFLKGVFSEAGEFILNIFAGIWNGIKSVFSGIKDFFINAINSLIGIANKIPGINIPLIPVIPTGQELATNIAPASIGVEVYDYTKSNSLQHNSPWTVKTADAEIGVDVMSPEIPKQKIPIIQAIIEPIFNAIPTIKVFAEVIFLKPLEDFSLFLSGNSVSAEPVFSLPGGGSISGETRNTYNTQTSQNKKSFGNINIVINTQSSDVKEIERAIERVFERLASQSDGVPGVAVI